MARYSKDFAFKGDPAVAMNGIIQFMTGKGYKIKEVEGETVFQKGNGWLTAPMFVKVTITPNSSRVEAWIKMALLPGVFVGEQDLEGFVGCAVKAPLKKMIQNELEPMLQTYANAAMRAAMEEQAQANANGEPAQFRFCAGCGTKYPSYGRFCPSCGRPAGQ